MSHAKPLPLSVVLLLLAVLLAACGPAVETADPSENAAEVTPHVMDTTGSADPGRDTLLTAGVSQPYVDRGVCPFECCMYRDWLARESLRVYRSERDTSEVAFTLAEGETFEGMTGNVYVDPVGVAVVTDTVTYGPNEAREQLLPGDTLYVLSPLGEGVFNMWHDGEVKEIYAFWGETGLEPGGVKGRLLREPKLEWWAHVRNREGQTGWINMDAVGGKIGNVDACAGPEE